MGAACQQGRSSHRAARFVTGQDLVVDGGLGLPGAGLDSMLSKLLSMIEKA